MVLTVFGRPPKNALLRGALRQDRENQLEDAARLEGSVREVAMIAGADGEDAQNVECKAHQQGLQRHARKDDGDAGEMKEDVGNDPGIYDIVGAVVCGLI